jgi:hypothetical protein
MVASVWDIGCGDDCTLNRTCTESLGDAEFVAGMSSCSFRALVASMDSSLSLPEFQLVRG